MELSSARELQAEVLNDVRRHTVKPSIAVGICRVGGGYGLAVRVQDPALLSSPLLDTVVARARGEIDVRFIGTVRPLMRPAVARWSRERVRPLMIGTSTGHVDVPFGTIGAFVTAGGVPCLLSNNHVLANENRARIGDPVVQPGTDDGGREPRDVVAELHRYVPLNWGQPNHVDAAVAALSPSAPCEPTILGRLGERPDARLSGCAACNPGDRIYKLGRTTGTTEGRVRSVNLRGLRIPYQQGTAVFHGQIEIQCVNDGSFAEGGDSGAIAVNGDGMAIGLVFAGQGGRTGLTYANPIHRVLEELDVTLLL